MSVCEETYAHGTLTLSSWILASEHCRWCRRRLVDVQDHGQCWSGGMCTHPFLLDFGVRTLSNGGQGRMSVLRKHMCTAYSPFPPGFWRQNIVDGVDGGLLTCTRWAVGTAILQQRSPLEPSPLPKGVNQVVNRGSRVVNRTWQSCESPFPPAREL